MRGWNSFMASSVLMLLTSTTRRAGVSAACFSSLLSVGNTIAINNAALKKTAATTPPATRRIARCPVILHAAAAVADNNKDPNNDGKDSLSSSSINGDDEASSAGAGNDTPKPLYSRVARTGWHHSIPDESSNFWVRGGGEGESGKEARNYFDPESDDDEDKENNAVNSIDKYGRQKSSQTKNEKTNNRFRTGWLHNQEPPSQQQQQPKSSSSPQQQPKPKSKNLARARLNQAMVESQRQHAIISPVAFHATSVPGKQVAVTEHVIAVPLRHEETSNNNKKKKKNERLEIYFSVVELVSDDNVTTRKWLESLKDLSPKQRAQTYVTNTEQKDASKMCLYLQGGPGFGAPTPVAALAFDSPTSSWAAQALFNNGYQRIVLLDQRGTGRSSPVTRQTFQLEFPNLFLLDEAGAAMGSCAGLGSFRDLHPDKAQKVQQALSEAVAYMTCFRADSIVRDAELVKEALLIVNLEDAAAALGNNENNKKNNVVPKPWGGCLGQSYGGFCVLTYLSQIEHPPTICLFTGGLAPVLTPVFDVYTQLWKRVEKRCRKFYDQYPGDVRHVKRIVQRLLHGPIVTLPRGGTLTARRFLQMGLNYLGSSPGTSFASFHAFLASAFVTVPHDHDDNVEVTTTPAANLVFSTAFLNTVESSQVFDDHPIYYWMHESIYANGVDKRSSGSNTTSNSETAAAQPPLSPTNIPTYWAAHRAYEHLTLAKPDVWDYEVTSSQSSLDDDSVKVMFFGEHIFPWMCDGDYGAISGLGLRALAHALAEKENWGPLWNVGQMKKVLQEGRSRAAAAVYHDDLYVDFDASMRLVDALDDRIKVYVTNEYQHSGLRDDGANLFAKLHGMASGSRRIPS